jgi:hypothetical protein
MVQKPAENPCPAEGRKDAEKENSGEKTKDEKIFYRQKA